MKTKKDIGKRIVVGMLAAAVLATAAMAQTEPVQPRQKLRENVSTLRLLRLTQALDLTEDQAARIFPLVNRTEREKVRIQRDMTRDLQELRKTLKGLPSDRDRDPDVSGTLTRVIEARRELRAREDELEAFLSENLTPIQRARYLIFQIDFYQGLGETLNQARLRHGMGPGQVPPAPVKKDAR
jgi:Spy/CpxP family protein refolding chaperone